MFISYNWLRELTGTMLTPAQLRERLTMVGLAIDAVADAGDDYVLDVEVPSNRPDCLSHVGIAREVATIEAGQVIYPPANPPPVAGRTDGYTGVEILDSDLCSRYAARVVRGVKIAPSPAWLAKRLEAIGQRSINNVADITNYVLHELGQPLHAFDLVKLSEQRIVVRRAKAGEKLKTLDGVERALNTDMLVIADAEHPVALAGIMGGLESEISLATTDVLIESAYFDPDSVRKTARALAMDTEASRRFEREVDFEGVIRAQDRCIELICEIAGGLATQNPIDVCKSFPARRRIRFHPSRVAALTSLQVETSEMVRVLNALGFEEITIERPLADHQPARGFLVPTWRNDVGVEEDLVEEIARHTGYNKIASDLPPARSAGEYQPQEWERRSLRRALTASGFDEAINFSFIETTHDALIETIPDLKSNGANPFVSLRNPILEGAVRMRPSLIPGLLNSLRHNLNHGQKDVRLFEIGRVFAASVLNELPREREALALIVSGGAAEEKRAEAPRALDFFDLKGALEAAVDAAGLGPLSFSRATLRHLRGGQSAAILIGQTMSIGALGRLAESVAEPYKFRASVYVAELDLTALLATEAQSAQYRPLARHPSVLRDVTLVVDRRVAFADLTQAVRDQRVEFCRDVKLVGTYEGANIPEGKCSITLRLEYRSAERTLRDDEVEEMHRGLVDQVVKKFGADLH